jgi:multidrug efflux pump subunit AcrB
MARLLHSIQSQSFGILTIFALFSVIGLALIPKLSLQYLPQYREPGFTVQVQWPGASPHTMEREVVSVLEGSFALIQGIERIYSESGQGTGRITLETIRNQDLDFLRFEIASRIRQIYPNLPDGVGYPTIYLLNPDREIQDRPILTYSLGGRDEVSAIYTYALEMLSPQLGLTNGIQRIRVQGGQEEEWLILFDEERLRQLQLQENDLITAIRQAFDNQVAGLTRQGDQEFTVRILHQPPDQIQPDWQNIPVATRLGQLIHLGDLARIIHTEQIPRQYYRINGKNSVRLLIYPEDQINQLDLAVQVKAAVRHLEASLPPSYQLYLDDDATEYLRLELDKIKQRTLFSLVILMLFLFLVYFNIRYFLAISLALLVNLALASVFYYLFSVQLHLYALAGITVSFGIIIDNAIVLSHHLYRQGNLLVFPALVASTLTTIASLTVIFFLPELWQVNLADFAKVLVINLLVSLLVALLFIPALLARMDLNLKTRTGYQVTNITRKANDIYKKILHAIIRKKSWVIALVILLFGLPVFMLPTKIEGWNWYNQSIGHEWFVENVRPAINKIFGGTLRLFVWYVYEGSSYRQPEETVLYVRASMPPGSTIDQMNSVFEKVENYLQQYPVEIKKYVSNIFSGDHAQMAVYFNKNHEYTFPYILKNRLISYSTNTGGVTWSIYGVGRGFSNAGGASPPRFIVSMYGYNDDMLKTQAEKLAGILLRHPRIQEVDINANLDWYRKDQFAFYLTLDHQKMAEQGVTARQVQEHLTTYDQGSYPDFYLPGRLAVRLVSDRQSKNDLWLWQNKLHAVDTSKFQFATLGTIEKQKMAQAIHKENQQYIRRLEFEYTGSYRFGSQYLDESMAQMKQMMPLGFTAERQTYSFFGKQKKKQYGLILLIIGLIFFICSIHFESFRQALAIVLLIPVSFIGIFLTFYWFDGSFDQGGYTSFILLSGLVVNSLILIINDYNYFRKSGSGLSNFEAYLLAFRQKFLPVMLTVVSTALGMIPFLMHGRQEVFWHALAMGTIGGLFFSVLVVMLVIPVFLLGKKDLGG